MFKPQKAVVTTFTRSNGKKIGEKKVLDRNHSESFEFFPFVIVIFQSCASIIDYNPFWLSSSWIWAIIGLILIVIELTHFGFVLVFLGFGALLTALVTAIELTNSLSSQLIAFSVFSLLLSLLFRNTSKTWFFRAKGLPSLDSGERVIVTKEIPPGGGGAITYRGTHWIAFSDLDSTILKDAMVEIVAIEGIRAKVKPIPSIFSFRLNLLSCLTYYQG